MIRADSLRSRLLRAGIDDVPAALERLADPNLATLGEITADHPLLAGLAQAADPDQALIGLARLAEVLAPDEVEAAALLEQLVTQERARTRLFTILGSSLALTDELVRRPELVRPLVDPALQPQPGLPVRTELLRSVGADPAAPVPIASSGGPDAIDALRRAYRTCLIRVAATDLSNPQPATILHIVTSALADLAVAALEAALAIARAGTPGHEQVRLAVIALGKTGGRELNYVSDVDVMYVAEPASGLSDAETVRIGTRLAAAVARVCGSPSSEPALWVVDANLRPEGKDGPLVRSLASYLQYYQRWAKTWEFQALLKARHGAGDSELGEQFVAATRPLVWNAASRENFVDDSQAMRRRVEANIPPAESERQLKLGAGGLRDVEFTVQLLQLVHGRADETVRSPNTLEALEALTSAGYVGRTEAAELDHAYRLLRVLEHRIQVHRMRRSHLIPTGEADLRRLGRSLGFAKDAAASLQRLWRDMRRTVRSLHERIYYRPLLPATAQLSPDEASLKPEAARARLASVGYRDPAAALRHITALTEGVSRRAAIQRQLLPVMIGWFAEGADPDAGLAAFRRLSDELGTTHWYLGLLRDSGVAARRLAQLLSTSVLVAEALVRSPDSVRWLADDSTLAPVSRERLETEIAAVITRDHDPEDAMTIVRSIRRRESARMAAAQLLAVAPPDGVAQGLADSADVLLAAALEVALASVAAEHGLERIPTRFAVIAMGRLGGREIGYGSDADVMFVHDPDPGTDGDGEVTKLAVQVAATLRSLLAKTGTEPGLEVDADLRPEGRNGPLVRSLASYAEYYARWSDPWEVQALLRARPVAGDPALGAEFVHLIDPYRYPQAGLDASTIKEIQRIKARVEAERLPRGADPARHLKLGRGGLADIEWTVQLLQMRDGARHAGLRTTSTLDALYAARDEGLIGSDDTATLAASWTLASQLRNAIALATGRLTSAKVDVLPHDRRELAGVARVLGYGGGAVVEEVWLRTARRARQVVERLFYGA